jgi:hypothetical protein
MRLPLSSGRVAALLALAACAFAPLVSAQRSTTSCSWGFPYNFAQLFPNPYCCYDFNQIGFEAALGAEVSGNANLNARCFRQVGTGGCLTT